MGNASSQPRAGVYFPGIHGHGGAERLALQLALTLSQLGWETLLFTDVEVDRVQIEKEFGAPLHAVEFRVLAAPKLTRSLTGEPRRLLLEGVHARQLRRARLDLFVNARFKSSVPGSGRENVYYVHFPQRLENATRGPMHRLYLAAMSLLDRTFVQRNHRGFVGTYDHVWANSAFTASHVESRWGVGADVVYPPCPQVRPLPKRKTIAVVSRFQTPRADVPHKAQEYLIDAFLQLTDLHVQGWTLVMIGGAEESDQSFIEALRMRAENAPIELVPNASRVQLEQILGSALIYWHAQGVAGDPIAKPETQEHFGISVVEAMSAKAVPIVFGHAGPAEIVAGLPGDLTWQDDQELVRLTRRVAYALPAELEGVQSATRMRARSFDETHFAAQIAERLGKA